MAQSPRTFAYTTQAGDTLESVTANFGMTEERFRELNPDLILEEGTPTASAPEEYPDGDAANPQSDSPDPGPNAGPSPGPGRSGPDDPDPGWSS